MSQGMRRISPKYLLGKAVMRIGQPVDMSPHGG